MATMQLADLRQELLDRGFNYLSTARANRFINAALGELYDTEDWPFRQAILTAQTPPVTIADLGAIETVVDTAAKNKLIPKDRREILDIWPDLSFVGTPSFYYITSGTTVNTWPVGGTLTIDYWKNPAILVNDSDTTLVPERFQLLIVDIAAQLGYADTDAWDSVQALTPVISARLDLMREALLWQQNDRSTQVEVLTGSGDW